MIKITADSTCDLSQHLLETYNISMSPLHIVVDEETFDDGVTITPTDIFRLIGQESKNVSTAAVNVFEYETFFSSFATEYEAIIHFSLGSHFSSSHQNAKIAAQNFPNVYVIDTNNLTTGSGYMILQAAQLAKEGKNVEEIILQTKSIIDKISVSFVVPTMEYLLKGGRCTMLEAIGATLLKIKPSIILENGQLVVGTKYRGSLDKVIEKYIGDLFVDVDSIDTGTLFITTAHCSEEMINKIKEVTASYVTFENIYVTTAGCTVSTHCGPNTFGLIFKTK